MNEVREHAAIFCSAAASSDNHSTMTIIATILDSKELDMDIHAFTLASKAFQFACAAQEWSLLKTRSGRAFRADAWALAESLLRTGWSPR